MIEKNIDLDSSRLSRAGDSFVYKKEIVRPFGGLSPVIDWCRTECSQDWRWQVKEGSSNISSGRYTFYFDSERDYVAFLLQWS